VAGSELFDDLVANDWMPGPESRAVARRGALRAHGFCRPHRVGLGMFRYVSRVVGKLLRPPGKLLVFEGADGVGKSTVMSEIVPWCRTWCSGRQPYRFHWKPLGVLSGEPEEAPSVDPRGSEVRSSWMSLLYLGYHVAGFWWGYFRHVYPKLVKSHVVVGDRYSFDFFLDPRRFRLGLPGWICRLAAMGVPRPGVAICLVADPAEIRRRKPELEEEEIVRYQSRWRDLADRYPWATSVNADEGISQTVKKVKTVVLETLLRKSPEGRGRRD
jgi:thymidylate kinase